MGYLARARNAANTWREAETNEGADFQNFQNLL